MATAGKSLRPPSSIVSDTGNIFTPLNDSFSFVCSARGKYVARDCVSLSKPLPHPTNMTAPAPPTQQNILAFDSQSPQNHSSGVKLVAIEHNKLPAGTSKPRKPRSSIKNNKSSFISRGVTLEGYNKRINPASSGLSSYLVLANYCRSFVLLDFDSQTESRHEPLSKVFFTSAWPLCHAVNKATASSAQLDVAVGTSTGDILWIELISNRYHRLNKTASITRAPVSAVTWLPGSKSLVAAAHTDGHVVIYDITAAEDGIIMKSQNGSFMVNSSNGTHNGPSGLSGIGGPNGPNGSNGSNGPNFLNSSNGAPPHSGMNGHNSAHSSVIMKVVLSRRQTQQLPGQKASPIVAAYKISEQPTTSLVFFSSSLLAVSSRDGFVRLIDIDSETVPHLVPSFFAGVKDVAVSSDGLYFAVAAEDDEISIHEVATCRPVAHLQGHAAWVSAIAFDPYLEEEFVGEDTKIYRLGSVGEDCTLILWEFLPSSLVAPRVSPQPLAELVEDKVVGGTTLHRHIPRSVLPVVLPVAQISPVLTEFGTAPMSSLVFTERAITAANTEGRLWTWKRPDRRNVPNSRYNYTLN